MTPGTDETAAPARQPIIGNETAVRLGLVLIIGGLCVWGGRLSERVESDGDSRNEAKAAIEKNASEARVAIEKNAKDAKDAIQALSDKVERVKDEMLDVGDVKLAVHEAITPELARLWEKLGAMEEWQRTQETRAAAK